MRTPPGESVCGAPPIKTTVFLADGRERARARLKQDFESHQFRVIGEASYGFETLERVSQLKPDVLVMNLAIPGLSGRHLAEQVLHTSPWTRVIIFWPYGHVAYVLENVPAGIMAHLVRVPTRRDLIQAVLEVLSGCRVPELARFWPRNDLERSGKSRHFPDLRLPDPPPGRPLPSDHKP